MIPGEIVFGDGPVPSVDGPAYHRVHVENTGDRPVQVGSHFHFAEANPALRFDRAAARGQRLAIAAGTSVRFEPGIATRRRARRFCRRPLCGRFPGRGQGAGRCLSSARSRYAALYGPTAGRPGAAGRHRPFYRGDRGPLRGAGPGRRRGGVRRGQGGTRVDGPGPGHPGRGGARPGHNRRRHPRLFGGYQSRHRGPGRAHRRHRQGRQPRHRWTASPPGWSSARPPRSSPATARSSPPAPSTATSTSSARRSWTCPWRRG